jgi:hypothetical protein
MSAFHPATQSSVPSTLTAQMPMPTVQALPFQASRQVPLKSVESLRLKSYYRFEDKVDELMGGYRPIDIPVRQKMPFSPINFIPAGRVLPDQSAFPPDDDDEDVVEEPPQKMAKAEGEGVKKLKKGSPAMKAHMAKLRAMRKKK